jgi:hypothetical protein
MQKTTACRWFIFFLAATAVLVIQGSPLIGGVNTRMCFDNDNLLHMAQVYGRTISSTLNADTGKIIEQLSYGEPGDLVAFPAFRRNNVLYRPCIFSDCVHKISRRAFSTANGK